MKKLIIVLISLLLLLSSFALGFFVKKSIDDKKYTNLIAENKKLKAEVKLINELNNKLTNFDNPIDINEQSCIYKTDNAADSRNCIYYATKEWEKEIDKYIKLLEQSTTKEQYKLIKDSQNLWLQQSKKDNDIINEFIFNHGGTMYFDIAASDYEELIKNRAEFLKWVYKIHTDRIPDNS